jgi:hypothetical protein
LRWRLTGQALLYAGKVGGGGEIFSRPLVDIFHLAHMLKLGNGELDTSASVRTPARSAPCLVMSVGFPLLAAMPALMHCGRRKRRERG